MKEVCSSGCIGTLTKSVILDKEQHWVHYNLDKCYQLTIGEVPLCRPVEPCLSFHFCELSGTMSVGDRLAYWKCRWDRREIEWHENDTHFALTKYSHKLLTKPQCRVFVPLCGKTADLAWWVFVRKQFSKIIIIHILW